MSAQINLFKAGTASTGRAYLTLTQVTVVALLTYAGFLGATAWSWRQVTTRQAEAALVAEEVKKIKAQADELAAKVPRPSPQLLNEIEQVQNTLRRRDEMSRLLEAAVAGGQEGFAEHLRGLARQVPEGLWLTNIAITAAGGDVEIRGSLIDIAALPEYIKRLGEEKTFRGRSFSALTLNRAGPPVPTKVASNGGALISQALLKGTVTQELQDKLTAKPGAFVSIPIIRTPAGELAGVMDFVLVPQRNGTQVGKEAKP